LPVEQTRFRAKKKFAADIEDTAETAVPHKPCPFPELFVVFVVASMPVTAKYW